jgi:acyl carrier protein
MPEPRHGRVSGFKGETNSTEREISAGWPRQIGPNPRDCIGNVWILNSRGPWPIPLKYALEKSLGTGNNLPEERNFWSMTEDVVLLKLREVFRDVFDVDSIVLRDDLTAKDVKGWDSIANIRLMLSVEQEFGFRFAAGEISELRNLGELVQAIVRHGG